MFGTTKIITATALAALCLAGCSQSGGENATASPSASPVQQAAPAAPPHPNGLAVAAEPGADVKNIMPDGVLITVTLPTASQHDEAIEREAAYVGETSVVAKRLAQAVQEGAGDLPEGADKLSLVVLRPQLDRLGKPDADGFMTLEFAVADLKAARIGTLGAFGVLNLATAVQVVLPWQAAVKPWCVTHVSAPNFCLLAQQSVAPELWEGAAS